MSLRLKVIISFIVIQATTSTIFVLLIIRDQHHLIEKAAKDSYLTVAKTLATACADALVGNDIALLHGYIKKVSRDDNVEYALIQDANNLVLASTEKDGQPSMTSPDNRGADAAQIKTPASDVLVQEVGGPTKVFFHSKGHLFDIAVPIFDKGQKLGLVRLGVSTRGVNQQVIQSAYRGIRWVIIAVVVGAAVVVLVDWKLRRIFSGLIEITQRMASGDLSQRIEINTGDALQILGDSFNQMAQNLRQSQEELRNFSLQLERRVEERTKELKEAQAQLIQSEKLASIGELTGNIAHEINNPVGIILSRLECMMLDADEEGLPEEFLVDLRVLEKHANRIANITGGLLTFSRSSAEEFAPVDVNEVICKTVHLLESQFARSNISVEKSLQEGACRVMGDADGLQQVFINLLNNALDAMPEGGRIKIETGLNSNGTEARITIADTGCGIAKKNLNRIFEPFFTTKEPGKGTGLGLSISYGIIREHNGTIQVVESEFSKGATFRVTLPVKKSGSTSNLTMLN
ncbi:MAG: ATP-binding protein [Candidatus Poribacteria bacterium]